VLGVTTGLFPSSLLLSESTAERLLKRDAIFSVSSSSVSSSSAPATSSLLFFDLGSLGVLEPLEEEQGLLSLFPLSLVEEEEGVPVSDAETSSSATSSHSEDRLDLLWNQ
jgi:hypothetical protein